MLDLKLNLEYSDEKFKMLFEFLPLGISLIDYETGKFLEVNDALLKSTNYTKEEFLEFSFWNFIQKKYKKQILTQIQNLKKYAKFGPIENDFIKNDGSHLYVKISGFIVTNDVGRKIVWVSIEDITKIKEYEIIYKDNKELLEYIALENDLHKILNKITNLVEKRNKNIKCSILLLDKSGNNLINGSAPSLPDFYNEAIDGIEIGEKVGSCGSAAFKRERVIVDNIDTHENWQPYLDLTTKANLHSCWSEPIISSNYEILGTFGMYNEIPKLPSDFELLLIETYANTISKAIEKHNYIQVIHENERKLEQLFDNSQSGLLYIDENKKLIKANQRFADILGYESASLLIGFSMEKFHLSHDHFIKFCKNNLDELILNQENFNIEYELKRRDGSSIWCELAGKALDYNFSLDSSKGILWTINDISLKKKYEFEVADKQCVINNIIRAIPDMIWLKDPKGVYLICNNEFEKFFGDIEENIVGKTDYDFVNKKLADFFTMHDNKALKSDDVIMNEEWVTYKSNGKKVLLDTSKKAIRNSKNELVGVFGIAHDVTKRSEREEELIQLNSLAQSLTKTQQVLLSLFDKGESILFKLKNDDNWSVDYVSKSVNSLLGYKESEFELNTISYADCIHKNDIDKVQMEIKKAIKDKADYFRHEPYRVISKSLQEKWFLDYTVTQKDEEGNITHFIRHIIDISEQVKNQEMMFHQSKIASLGEMLGNISHQWRQPLSVISTTATGAILKKELGFLDEEEFIDNMNSINESAQYLSRTIDDFRNFYLSDSILKTKIKLEDSIEKVISLIKDSYKSSNIEIIKNYNNIEIFTMCNENLLIQLLINIFNNASDAFLQYKNSKSIKYVFIDLIKNKNTYEIIIKDNAGGISKDNISKVFDPYFTTKHQSQGTGIGLYMTSQIISKQFKGKIYVENIKYEYLDKKYTGASFRIVLPLE